MKIAVVQSTQETSSGSGIGSHNESELMGDFCARLVPKLQTAGHNARHFNAVHNELGDVAARAAVAWKPDVAYAMHLDSAGGAGAAMFCYMKLRSRSMGSAILAPYCTYMGYRNKGGQLRILGLNGGRVAVIRILEEEGNIPTSLFECGDMDAPDGSNWLRSAYREKAATAMAMAICAYAGGVPGHEKRKQPQEEDMEIVEQAKPKRFPAYNDGGNANAKFDITDESPDGKGAKVRLFFRRNDGDKGYASKEFGDTWTRDIAPETSLYVDVAKDFKVVGSISVKVEVLTGGPVGVTRRQDL